MYSVESWCLHLFGQIVSLESYFRIRDTPRHALHTSRAGSCQEGDEHSAKSKHSTKAKRHAILALLAGSVRPIGRAGRNPRRKAAGVAHQHLHKRQDQNTSSARSRLAIQHATLTNKECPAVRGVPQAATRAHAASRLAPLLMPPCQAQTERSGGAWPTKLCVVRRAVTLREGQTSSPSSVA